LAGRSLRSFALRVRLLDVRIGAHHRPRPPRDDVEDHHDRPEEALDDPHRSGGRERPLLGVAQPVGLRENLPEHEDDAAGDDRRHRDGDAAREPVREQHREDAGDGDVDDVVADQKRHEEAVWIVAEFGEDRRPTVGRDAFVEPRPRQREDRDLRAGEESTRRQQADQCEDARRHRVEGGHTSRPPDDGKSDGAAQTESS